MQYQTSVSSHFSILSRLRHVQERFQPRLSVQRTQQSQLSLVTPQSSHSGQKITLGGALSASIVVSTDCEMPSAS